MRGCSPAPNEADRLRFLAFQDMGCICCAYAGFPAVPAEVHHIVQADNQRTLPLCCWHHRGVPRDRLTCTETERRLGPSLARSRYDFEAHFGLEEQLLEVVDRRVRLILDRERVA